MRIQDAIGAVIALIPAPNMSAAMQEWCETADGVVENDDLMVMTMSAIMLFRDVQEVAPGVAAVVLARWAALAEVSDAELDDMAIEDIERNIGG